MIPAGLRMFVAVEPIDMRRSIDGLVLAVTERLQQDAKVERALAAILDGVKQRPTQREIVHEARAKVQIPSPTSTGAR